MDAGLDLEKYEDYIHGRVPAELLKEYMSSGLDLDKHEDYIHSRVSPDFLKTYLDAGLDLDKHEEFIHGRVSPSLLKKYLDACWRNPENQTELESFWILCMDREASGIASLLLYNSKNSIEFLEYIWKISLNF